MIHTTTDPACIWYESPRNWWQRRRFDRARGKACVICRTKEPDTARVPYEVLIRTAYALLLASDTTHKAPVDAVRWRADRHAFMTIVQAQVLSRRQA